MAIRVLEIGGVIIPLHASLGLTQTYTALGGSTTRRALSGAAVRRTHWRRLATTLSAQGSIPTGLQALDYDAPLTLRCVAARSVYAAGAVITLPTARRSDAGHTARGYALVGQYWQVTSAIEDGDTLTLTAVPGASRYRADYLPELTVVADPPQEDHDRYRDEYRWTLTAEEV